MDTMSDPMLAIKIVACNNVNVAYQFSRCSKTLRVTLNYIMYTFFENRFFSELYMVTSDYSHKYISLVGFIDKQNINDLTLSDARDVDQLKYIMVQRTKAIDEHELNCALSYSVRHNLPEICDYISKSVPKEKLLRTYDDSKLLYTAAKYGHDKVAKVLLRYGADVNSTNGYFDSALYIAVKKEQYVVCMVLLQAGANVDGALAYVRNSWYQDKRNKFFINLLMRFKT